MGSRYQVKTVNRFMLEDDSDSSSDEQVQNIDPYAMMQKAQTDAVKKAKQQAKDAIAARKKQQVKIPEPEAEEKPVAEKKQNNNNNRRDNNRNNRGPRAENGPRYGKRNEDSRPSKYDSNNNAVSENNNNNNQAEQRDNDRRQKRPRAQDRRSGNPRSGVKAQEKRGGAGAGNWGKATDQGDPEDKEQITPEEPAENTENANPEAENQENEDAEPAEPEIPQLSLEEYMASLNTDAPAEAKDPVRKANDGVEIKGRKIKKKFVFQESNNQQSGFHPRENAKQHVPQELIGFQSDYKRGGNRGGDRGGDRRGDRRGGDRRGDRGDNNRAPKKGGNNQKFSLEENLEAFPTLGK